MLNKETNKKQNKKEVKETGKEQNKEQNKKNRITNNKEQNKKESRTINSEEINKKTNKEEVKKQNKEKSKTINSEETNKDKLIATTPDNITLISSLQLQNNKNEEEENNIFNNIKDIINISRSNIARTVNSEMVNCYWNIGKYIYEIQGNKSRADYGTYLIKYLSERLTKEFGRGFSTRNLKDFRQFYETFSILHTQNTKSQKQIGHSVRAQSSECPEILKKLSWTHLRTIMRLNTEDKRNFYIKECIDCNWSVRQLERQIYTSYYERLLSTQQEYKQEVRDQINTTEPDIETKTNPLFILKDPYILEFLNMKEDEKYLEKELESRIINNLQDFMLELGKGFTFLGRQRRITIDGDHYYIDLVFYNIILKCYVLIDLKIGKVKHQDMGQMDMYINYFDKEIVREGDNPTIGIVLCTEKNTAVVKYSTLNDNKRLFISKYMEYLPTEEELTDYIVQQSELFTREHIYLEDNNNKDNE